MKATETRAPSTCAPSMCSTAASACSRLAYSTRANPLGRCTCGSEALCQARLLKQSNPRGREAQRCQGGAPARQEAAPRARRCRRSLRARLNVSEPGRVEQRSRAARRAENLLHVLGRHVARQPAHVHRLGRRRRAAAAPARRAARASGPCCQARHMQRTGGAPPTSGGRAIRVFAAARVAPARTGRCHGAGSCSCCGAELSGSCCGCSTCCCWTGCCWSGCAP